MNTRLRGPFVLVAFFLVIGTFPGWPDVSTLQDKEDLLFEEIPIVITASRKEQPITQAASVVTVINSDTIAYSGFTNIPDLLRMAAGIDVVSITPRHQQVSVRGFAGPSNNKLLVLIDGRTVFSDTYGMVFWDAFPIGLEEIDRIEIVKSPSSSIYGANAFTGVINIITKTPEQLEGTTLKVSLGNENTFIAGIIQAGKSKSGNFQYKVSAELDRTREWAKRAEARANVTRYNGLMQYRFNPDTKFTLSFGRGHSRNRRLYQSGGDLGEVDDVNDYLQADLEYKKFQFRFFYKSNRTGKEEPCDGPCESWPARTLNAEIFHTFQPFKNHMFIWGINYRYNNVENNPNFDAGHHQTLWSLFLEDEITLSKRLRITLGGRFDTHPLAGSHFSPRGSLTYNLSDRHIFRLSYARAFRNPTFNDSYLFKTWTVYQPGPFMFVLSGNKDLKPERNISHEFGYRGTLSKHFRIGVDLFFNSYSDFFGVTTELVYYEPDELYPGSPGDTIPKGLLHYPINAQSARGIGGEISCDIWVNKSVFGFINYSYQEITDKEDDSTTTNVNERNRIRPYYPRHKINAGLTVMLKKFSLNFTGHWVDKTKQLILVGRDHLSVRVAPYFLLHTRLGFSFLKQKAEVALSVQNVFDIRHYEYPTVGTEGGNQGEESVPNHLGRRITISMRYKF